MDAGRHAFEMASHVRATGQITEDVLGVEPVGSRIVDDGDFIAIAKASGGNLTRSA